MTTFWSHDSTPSKRGRAMILEGGQWVPYEAFNRESEQLEIQDRMTRFPLKAVETSGHYFLRADQSKEWRHCYVNLEDETVSLVGSVAEVHMSHATSFPNAELYGPISFPPESEPLSDGPLPF